MHILFNRFVWNLRVYISNKLPEDIDVADPSSALSTNRVEKIFNFLYKAFKIFINILHGWLNKKRYNSLGDKCTFKRGILL